jgi:hypothetical protein
MSELDKMGITDDVFEAIQSSIPDGQAIQHIVLAFNNKQDRRGRWIPDTEYFLAVTDSFLVTRTTRWEWVLVDEEFLDPGRPKIKNSPSLDPEKVAKNKKYMENMHR